MNDITIKVFIIALIIPIVLALSMIGIVAVGTALGGNPLVIFYVIMFVLLCICIYFAVKELYNIFT